VLSDIAPEMDSDRRGTSKRPGSSPTSAPRKLDMEQIDFPDASFDVFAVPRGLMWCRTPAAALKEAHRVLGPGGRGVFAVWGPRELNPWLGMLLDAITETLGIPVPPPGNAGPVLVVRETASSRNCSAPPALAASTSGRSATPMNAGSFDEMVGCRVVTAGPVGPLLAGQPPMWAGRSGLGPKRH